MPYTVQNLKKLKFYPDWKDWREIVILIEAMTGEQLGPEFRPIIRSRAGNINQILKHVCHHPNI